jgi:hypothetical protein
MDNILYYNNRFEDLYNNLNHINKNYQHLLTVYNQWIEHNPDMGRPLTNDTLDQFANVEKIRWTPSSSGLVVSAEQNSR